MGVIERNDDAKALFDMVDVLYRQGKDAEYIIGALIAYAQEANVPLPATAGAPVNLDDAAEERACRALLGEEWWEGDWMEAMNVVGLVVQALRGQ